MTVRRDRFTSPASIDSREQDRVRSSCFVLGLNGSNRVNIWDALPGWAGHDAAAVLLRDGQLIAAIEEERLDRIKHSNHFPVQAIKECLNLAGIGPEDLDIVALNIKGQSAEGHDPTDLRSSVSALFQAYIGDVRKAKSCFIDHQLAHLYSAYIPSGFEECLCLSLDSLGDGASGAIGHAHGGQIQILRRLVPKQSLGDLCCDLVRVLGYSRFDEYKVMALAALGRGSAHADLFSTMYKLLPDGKFELARDEERWRSIRNLDLVKPRSQGEPFSQSHFDFAAGLQDMVIKFVLHLLGHFCDHTGLSRLALAGGFAQNCAVNGRILYSGIFDHVFVQPAAQDAGGALGAAFAAFRSDCSPAADCDAKKSGDAFNVHLGRAIPQGADLRTDLESWRSFIDVEGCDDAFDYTAQELEKGRIIGWMQGRAEFGPRALGNRSILADPRCTEARDRINRNIKRREPYRPFAPAVLEEEVWHLFEKPPSRGDLGFMTFLLPMKTEARSLFPAVVHADGTARVQVVSRARNACFHELISEFSRRTNSPLVLNTSFNGQGEPIVDTVEGVIACFLLTGLDLFVVDSIVARAAPGALSEEKIYGLRVSLPPSRKIAWRSIPGTATGKRRFFIETTFTRYFGGESFPIGEDSAAVLMRADGICTIEQLCSAARCRQGTGEICRELLMLWRRGHVRMRAA
jgi:carbamoyltransferase